MNKLTIYLTLLTFAFGAVACEKEQVLPQPQIPPANKNTPTRILRAEIAPDRINPRFGDLITDLEREEDLNPACRELRNPSPFLNEQFTLEGLTMNDGCMDINLAFSGGCEQHLFALTWNGEYANTQQSEVTLNLLHYSNGDMCEAWITESRGWDLSPIRVQGRTSGSILVNVVGWNGQTRSINYTY